MADNQGRVLFSFQDLAKLMIKDKGIREGLWGIYVRFGIGAVNAADATGQFLPTALVPIREIGLQKFDAENNLSIDAAKVKPPTKQTKRQKPARRKRTGQTK